MLKSSVKYYSACQVVSECIVTFEIVFNIFFTIIKEDRNLSPCNFIASVQIFKILFTRLESRCLLYIYIYTYFGRSSIWGGRTVVKKKYGISLKKCKK